MLFARTGPATPPPDAERSEKKIVHLKSDNSGPVAPGDSVVFLIGNVAAQHNGTVITCDSAVRYSDSHVECFGNVLINKNTTYIYGDRADYDRDRNTVEIYAPLVKVVDGEATLYARRFRFNTLDNIGEFAEGGVLTNGENVVEAVRGYYYADTKELVAVGEVEMRNEEYELRGDSVAYRIETDDAFFFDRTHIWNADGDFLLGDRGSYAKAETRYTVTRNGYLLTAQQELWSDSIDYFRAAEHVVLRSNIQIDETEHRNLCFGDYGEYWKNPGNAFLTARPSIVNYDTERNTDSIFMRCDSIYLYTLRRGEPVPDEYALNAGPQSAGEEPAAADSVGGLLAERRAAADRRGEGLLSERRAEGLRRDAAAEAPQADGEGPRGADTLPRAEASGAADSLGAADSRAGADSVRLSPEELRAREKQRLKEAAAQAAAEKRAAKAAAKKELLERIAAARQQKKTARLRAQERRDSLAAAKRKARAAKSRRRRLPDYSIDAAEVRRLDSLSALRIDSTERLLDPLFDSLLAARPLRPSFADSVAGDSVYRFMKGFRNVKIFRNDLQAVCDSITGSSTDSTLHLFIEPVLWNERNQVTSEVMDIHTMHRQLHYADFIGAPMMVQQIDTVHYNQIAGKRMEAYFRENAIYRIDVNGNVQTIYYLEDGYPSEAVAVAMIESGDASFFIEEKQLSRIVYRIEPSWPIYPLDKVPDTKSIYLKGFKWQGERRPARSEVFDRTIRPSRRALYERLERPSFPIREAIDAERKRLVEEGLWADRDEQVDAVTVDWMHALGFEVGQPRRTE